jgi:HAD superfamily hydrolase (TIGR01509 family)
MSVMPPTAALQFGLAKDLITHAPALIFDVDGTMAETEEVHRQAFNEAFVRAGVDWYWSRTIYKELLWVAGGKERIRAFERDLEKKSMLSESQVAELHRLKTARYVELVAGGACPLRPGVEALVTAAKQRGQRLAIATTTSRQNIDVLLSTSLGEDWCDQFDAIVAGDEVPRKKPAPDVYYEVLARLGLPASDCVAIEDSYNGLVAASRAGIRVLITRSFYCSDQDFSEALLTLDDLSEFSTVPG